MLSIDEAIAKEREVLAKNKYQYECYIECSDNYKQNHKETIAQCKYDFEYHEQVAEWLEELKEYRKHIELTAIPEQYKLGFQDGIVNGFENGYNKAIDDFSNKIIDIVNDFPTVENEDGEIRPMRIEEICNNISEKLKAGGEDE